MTITVTLLPVPLPDRDDPDTFADRADAVMAQLNATLAELHDQNSENNDLNDAIVLMHAAVQGLAADVASNSGNINTVAANIASVIAVAANVVAIAAAGANIAAITAVDANAANINAAVADLPSLSAKVSKTGDTMTGHLNVPAGASGSQVPRASEALLKADNLSGLANAATARTNLGLGSAATRTALGSTGSLFSRDSVLGTVSQSAGVPTGALIETGSNANGEYVRFANGTQICTFVEAANSSITTALGSLFVSAPKTLTYPAAFTSVVRCMVGANDSTVSPCWCNQGTAGLTSVGNVYLFATANTATAKVSYIAIGKWF